MPRKIHFHGTTRNAKGDVGVHATVDVTANGWFDQYHFSTHGMNAQQVAAKVEKISDHHAKKAARLDGFRELHGKKITFAGRQYVVTDCTFPFSPRSHDGDIGLIVDVREEGTAQSADGFPIKRTFATIDDVTDNVGILAMVRERLKATSDMQKTRDETVAAAKALLGDEVKP